MLCFSILRFAELFPLCFTIFSCWNITELFPLMLDVDCTSLLITTTISEFSISYALVFKITLDE